MDIILIVAITIDGYIARRSDEVISWSKDLKLFKKQTMGYPVIMGSNTEKTLAVELKGREKIVVHRNDDPKKILENLDAKKCFVIGGGKTYTKFAPFLTHMYITLHPIVFGKGIQLFSNLKEELSLKFIRKITVDKTEGIFQFQYKVIK
ncbi:dihydrofolate reductase family protein [bacterium]|nr:dihydrofolate reductase family protein [bacterium]